MSKEVKVRLPLNVVNKLKKVRKMTKVPVNKIINVLLAMYIESQDKK